eukprot:Phypoly_transcript_07265.p1 GENE.Phypoly_transcript_07265~~Phypoly_transcript_07265.p1  ORF type:complete len:374 (+),score=50.91 Phypoly_transcript_07265:63-1124(+)
MEIERIAKETAEVEKVVGVKSKKSPAEGQKTTQQFLDSFIFNNRAKLAELKFSGKSILSLASTCSSFHKLLLPLISDFTFVWPESSPHFTVYKPKKLKTAHKFSGPINMQMIPLSVTHLIFNQSYSRSIDKLPSTITHITFGKFFNFEITNHLPESLVYLKLGNCFIQEINHLPKLLKILVIGDNFNHPVDHLPSSLTHLTLGRSFNHPLDHLPPTLIYLFVQSYVFNQLVDHLPESLLSLSLPMGFDQPINHLPPFLEQLTLSYKFNQTVDMLPKTIKKLVIHGSQFNHPIPSLPHLTQLPHRITFLQPSTEVPPSHSRDPKIRTWLHKSSSSPTCGTYPKLLRRYCYTNPS